MRLLRIKSFIKTELPGRDFLILMLFNEKQRHQAGWIRIVNREVVFSQILRTLSALAVIWTLRACHDAEGDTRPLHDGCELPTRTPDTEARLDERPTDWTPDFTLDDFTSHLPILVLNTNGNPIVDEPKVSGTFVLRSRDGVEPNRLVDPPVIETAIGIELRGQSRALAYPKKQFNVEIRDDEGKDSAMSVLKMAKAADWVINGTPEDTTRLRNIIGYTLARRAGLPAPETRPVELFIDVVGQPLSATDYFGMNVIIEKIQYGRDMMDLDPDLGFVLELNEVDTVWVDEPWFCAPETLAHVIHIWPKKGHDLTPARQSDIIARFDAVEKALQGPDWSRLEDLIDVDSFLIYWLFNELTWNVDSFRRSFYIHMGPNGRLRPGPVWDLDIALGLAQGGTTSDWSTWGWGKLLVAHEEFQNRLPECWRSLRKGPWSTDALIKAVDDAIMECRPALERDLNRWGIVKSGVPVTAPQGELDRALDFLRTWIPARAKWIDAHIDTL